MSQTHTTQKPDRLDRATRRRGRRLRAAAGACGLILAWVFVWLALWALAPAVAGWRPVVIASDSMLPAIRAGDVIVARPHSGIGLGPGAVVVFDPGDGRGLITHRIAAVNDDGTYTTGGDANASTDSTPLHPDQVIGVGTLRVPYIGIPLLWLQGGSPGKVVGLLAGLAAAVWLTRSASTGAPRRAAADRPDGAIPVATEPHPARSASMPTASGPGLGAILMIVGLITIGAARGAFADTTANAGSSVSAWQAAPDVAVIEVRAPATARTGDTVAVEVDVANLGGTEATFEVRLGDVTKGQPIGTETVTLGPGGATTVVFSWKPGGPQGDRLLEAEAILADDADPDNDTATATVVITSR
jgi:signal peptidase I